MADFSLTAHICGEELSVSARDDGTGWVVHSSSGSRATRRFQVALHLARDEVGTYLTHARRDQPWGLVVTVGGASALYGTPHPAAGVSIGGPPGDPNSLIARIRRRWRDGDSPVSALENAVQIIRALAESPARAAA